MVIETLPNRRPIAIIVAPNGARKTKQDHLNLPMSIDELVAEARACQVAGATMIHLHARDVQGKHSLEFEDNFPIYHAVKEVVGDEMIVQLTTEAVGQYSPRQQMELVKAVRPEAASFALRELIADHKSEKAARDFFYWVSENNILSQVILYDEHDIERYFQYRTNGVLPNDNQHALVVLGRYHKDQQSSPWNLRGLSLERFQQQGIRCAVCAFGVREQDCLTSAMLLGLDVRVGFENNHLDASGEQAESNATQVKMLNNISQLLSVPLDDARSFRASIR